MLSNEVVARARKLVGEHVLENLLAVSIRQHVVMLHRNIKNPEIHVLIGTLPFEV